MGEIMNRLSILWTEETTGQVLSLLSCCSSKKLNVLEVQSNMDKTNYTLNISFIKQSNHHETSKNNLRNHSWIMFLLMKNIF